MNATASLLLAAAACLAASPASGNSLPVISNVVVGSRGHTLTIQFDLSDDDGDDMTVLLRACGTDVSIPADDAGVSGDVGAGVNAGTNRRISIDLDGLAVNVPEPFVPRLLAFDGTGLGSEMVAVDAKGGPDFLIDRFEVTNEQFAAFLRSDGYEWMEYWIVDDGSIEIEETGWNYAGRFAWNAPRYWNLASSPPWLADPISGSASSPVLGISWFEAYAYCKWAGRRLPTSGEWAEAAGLSEARYPWGGTADGGSSPPLFGLANIKYGYDGYASGGFEADGYEFAAPVGSYTPQGDSPLGLADVFGNVWEWCGDAVTVVDYGTYSCATRSLRGGSWATSPSDLREPIKDLCPLYRTDMTGFRCAR